MSEQTTIGTTRLEAFSDGVIAIIITIMVLELKVPHGDDPMLLLDALPTFVAYAISFLTIAVFWVNHHDMLHRARHATTVVLWTNMLWLFFLSLVPFFTAYLTEDHITAFSASLYAGSMMVVAIAFLGLRVALAQEHRGDPVYYAAYCAASLKHYAAIAGYPVGIALSPVSPYITVAVVFLISAAYFIPDAWLKQFQPLVGGGSGGGRPDAAG